MPSDANTRDSVGSSACSARAQPQSREPLSGQEAWFALNSVKDLGAASLLRLARRFGSPEAALAASREELIVLGRIASHQADQICALAADPASVRRQIAALAQARVRLLSVSDAKYPGSLLALRTPPPLLYLKGRLTRDDSRAVAVVGTRNPTPSAAHLARQLAAALARAGWTVVSGLALGIDTAAHEAALDSGGRTIAVLGCGLRRSYPPENAHLANSISRAAENQGCLLAEVPPWASVSRGALLARDRLQAGLSLATVVVQAHESCGSIVTAKHALACKRTLFAVPWECEPFAAGWKRLREMGAGRINSPADLIRALSRLQAEPPPPRSRLL